MTPEDKAEVIEMVRGEVTQQLQDQPALAKDKEFDRQDKRQCFQELCGTARHYSALRFAMFTVFTTILAGLIGLDLRPYGSPAPAVAPPPSLIHFLRFASLALALVFGLLQWRVSTLIAFYQEQADTFANQSPGLKLPLHPRHTIWKYIVPIAMLAPFVLAFGFFVWRLRT